MKCPTCGQENRDEARFCDGCGAALPVLTEIASADQDPWAASAGFVGRDREMKELREILQESVSSQGRLVMLLGEPGIGKTRTSQELADHAEELGVQVHWGRCYDGEGAPPYWPWVQLLRSFLQRTDSDQLARQMGPGAADIGEIVPEVREKLPNLVPPPVLEPEQARFRLFDSIGGFLRNLAQAQPLMLILDDLHWADRPSLMLLEFLVQELERAPVLIVGTYRDIEVSRGDPLSATLGNILRQPSFRRIALEGLSEPEVGELLTSAAGVSPSSRLVEAIHSRTEGNPLFVGEISRMLGRERLREGQEQTFTIPEGVRETIGRRLVRLSEQCHQGLATASVIGREFDFPLLAALTVGTSEDQLLRVIDEALETHLIEEVSGAQERYQFSHALIQDTLSEELSTSRRVRLHARVGETLEDLYGAAAPLHAAELAHHFGEARGVLGEQKLVQYSRLAGEQALAAYANQEAMEHFQLALECKEGKPMDGETAALLSGLGRAQAATLERHRMPEVIATLSLAADYFAEVGEVDQVTAIAEYPIYPLFGQSTGNAQLIEFALSHVPADSLAAGRLFSRYGWIVATEEGDYDRAQQSFNQALTIARREGDASLELKTLAHAANVDMLYTEYQRSVENSHRALDLSAYIDEPEAEVIARYSLVMAYIGLGNLEGMNRQAPALLATAERLRDRFWLTCALRSYEDCAHLAGDWTTARSYSDRGLAVSPSECRSLCTRAMIECQMGNFAAGEAYVDKVIEVMRQTPPGPTLEHAFVALVVPFLARLSGNGERNPLAQSAAEVTLAAAPRVINIDWLTRTGLALLAEQTGDAKLASEQYPHLMRLKGSALMFVMVSNDRILGLLAKTMGDLDRAATHFQEARAFCSQAGYRPELGWTDCDYAGALLQRNGAGDRTQAASLLEEAREIASELGMLPLLERVQARLEFLAAGPAPAPSYPGGLSQREVEVLRLIAAGRSNRDIAEELFISLNTVANHVRNILTKTDTANRTEAAAYAQRYNLIQS
ncbi:MAG: AAA family ATPase [Dehalococcoidia bacterium]